MIKGKKREDFKEIYNIRPKSSELDKVKHYQAKALAQVLATNKICKPCYVKIRYFISYTTVQFK